MMTVIITIKNVFVHNGEHMGHTIETRVNGDTNNGNIGWFAGNDFLSLFAIIRLVYLDPNKQIYLSKHWFSLPCAILTQKRWCWKNILFILPVNNIPNHEAWGGRKVFMWGGESWLMSNPNLAINCKNILTKSNS